MGNQGVERILLRSNLMTSQRTDHMDGGYVLVLRAAQIQNTVVLAVGNHRQNLTESRLIQKVVFNISRKQIPDPPAADKFHVILQS